MLMWTRQISKEKYEFKGMIPLRALYFNDLEDTECKLFHFID